MQTLLLLSSVCLFVCFMCMYARQHTHAHVGIVQVVAAGGVAPLAALLRNSTDLLAQRAAILALQQLAIYGDSKVRHVFVRAVQCICAVCQSCASVLYA